MNTTDGIPQAWDDERDGQFFRITASLFPTSFCYGASVMLASYDVDDFDDAPATVPAITPSTDSAISPMRPTRRRGSFLL